MSLRGRIFAVIGLMVAAAFLQAGAVVWFETLRDSSGEAMMRAGQRFDHQTRMNRVVAQLENEHRSYLLIGLPAFRADFDRRWREYVNLPTLLVQYVDEEQDKKSVAEVDRQLQQWHQMVTDLMDRREQLADLPRVLRDETLPPWRLIQNALETNQRRDMEAIYAQIQSSADLNFNNEIFMVALATIEYIEKHDLPAHAEKMGQRFMSGLADLKKKYPDLIIDVRGKGLMLGMEFPEDSIGPRMAYQLRRNGVISIYTFNNPRIIRIMPALVITEEEVDFVLNAFDLSLTEIKAQEERMTTAKTKA